MVGLFTSVPRTKVIHLHLHTATPTVNDNSHNINIYKMSTCLRSIADRLGPICNHNRANLLLRCCWISMTGETTCRNCRTAPFAHHLVLGSSSDGRMGTAWQTAVALCWPDAVAPHLAQTCTKLRHLQQPHMHCICYTLLSQTNNYTNTD